MPDLTLEPLPPRSVVTGTTLLDASEDLGAPLESDCGGVAACSACRVRVIRGSDQLSPRHAQEEPFLDRDDQRLGCQAKVFGPVTVRPDPGM